MKSAIVLLLLCITISSAETPREADIRRAKALKDETIPKLELKGATFEQAFDLIRANWDRSHPKESFPVVFTDFDPPSNIKETSPAKLTMHLRNIPYIEAIRYIASCSNRLIMDRGGVLDLLQSWGFLRDWTERIYKVSPAALAQLQLQKNSSAELVRQALKRFGIVTSSGGFELESSGRQLRAVCTYPEHEKISGVLSIFDAGYKISK